MRRPILVCLLLFSSSAICLSVTRLSPTPVQVDMRVGQSRRIQVPGSSEHRLQLVSYKETTAPYYSSAVGMIIPAVVYATADMTLDGKPLKLAAEPYQMPTRVGDLDMLLVLTKHWTGGIDPIPLRGKADVRLEIQSANAPWVNVGPLYFPINNYRWHASNYQHTYLGIVNNQARLYYHRGEDLGMIPDLAEVLSMTSGVVSRVPGPNGDGGSNGVIIQQGRLTVLYDHMNAPNIPQYLQPGVHVTAGEVLGLTGNTWRGKPVNDPHLHVGVGVRGRGSSRYDGYPVVVTAYRETFPGEVLPVAGSPYYCYAGDTVKLDGGRSLPPLGSHLVDWQWKFTDGSTASGRTVDRRFDKPGGYSEELKVTDAAGRSDIDFGEVFVLSKDQKEAPPYIWISYYPIRPVYVNEPVRFRIRYAHVKMPEVDFGDGTSAAWSKKLYHTYSKPGTYVVTVHGADAGVGPGIFKVRVIVENK